MMFSPGIGSNDYYIHPETCITTISTQHVSANVTHCLQKQLLARFCFKNLELSKKSNSALSHFTSLKAKAVVVCTLLRKFKWLVTKDTAVTPLKSFQNEAVSINLEKQSTVLML